MSQLAKSVTGNSITSRTKMVIVSDMVSLPLNLKNTQEIIKSTKRSKAI